MFGEVNYTAIGTHTQETGNATSKQTWKFKTVPPLLCGLLPVQLLLMPGQLRIDGRTEPRWGGVCDVRGGGGQGGRLCVGVDRTGFEEAWRHFRLVIGLRASTDRDRHSCNAQGKSQPTAHIQWRSLITCVFIFIVVVARWQQALIKLHQHFNTLHLMN